MRRTGKRLPDGPALWVLLPPNGLGWPHGKWLVMSLAAAFSEEDGEWRFRTVRRDPEDPKSIVGAGGRTRSEAILRFRLACPGDGLYEVAGRKKRRGLLSVSAGTAEKLASSAGLRQASEA